MKRVLNILHLEDNLSDAELIRFEIEKALPNAVINHVVDKKSYFNAVKSSFYDLVISDFNVPGISEKESLELAQTHLKNAPFIYVSGAIGEELAVELLKSGATDYVLKSRLSKLPIAISRAIKEIDDRILVQEKEAEIRKSNEFRASILNALSTHIAVIDNDGVIIETNKVWDKYIGKQSNINLQSVRRGDNYLEEILRMSSVIDPELKKVYDGIVKVMDGEFKFYYYDYNIGNSQHEKWYTMRVTPRLDGDGAVIAHSNITDRVQSEKRLRKSEGEFKSLAENAPSLIVKLDRDFQVVYMNKNVLGLNKSECVGKSAFQLIDPNNEKLVREKLSDVFKTGNPEYYMTIRSLQDTEPMVLGTYVGPVFDDKGVVQSLVLLIRDMTDETRDKELLKESEIRFRGIFEGMSEGILHIDETGTIKSVNPGICKMLGYTETELVGKVCYDFLHDEVTSKRLRKKMQYRKKGEGGKFEAKFLRKSGDELWASISAQPDYNANGDFIGVMSIIMDITERKKADLETMEMKEAFTKDLELKVAERTKELEDAQYELAQALAKEKELGELKSRFVSTASHQFRTPLSVIQTSMGILSMQKDIMGDQFEAVFDRVYGRVKEQIEQMTDLMNDVLILGKINAGNITVRLIETDLVDLCKNIAKSHAVINSDKRIVTTVKGNPFEVELDAKLFEHSLSNFISNAMKYSPENSTTELKLDFNKDEVKIIVKDKGIGIPEEELPYLFDPFYRASNAKEITGTGLGTSIAKEYLELINGKVKVNSQVGVGTEIQITFEKQNKSKKVLSTEVLTN